jgi:hypothetical protein
MEQTKKWWNGRKSWWVGKILWHEWDMQSGICNFFVVRYATAFRTKYGANTFAYPFEYPKHMTDWRMYAKFFACTHTLNNNVCSLSDLRRKQNLITLQLCVPWEVQGTSAASVIYVTIWDLCLYC